MLSKWIYLAYFSSYEALKMTENHNGRKFSTSLTVCNSQKNKRSCFHIFSPISYDMLDPFYQVMMIIAVLGFAKQFAEICSNSQFSQKAPFSCPIFSMWVFKNHFHIFTMHSNMFRGEVMQIWSCVQPSY